MKKEEIAKVLKRIEIVVEWYEDMTDGEYRVGIDRAQELLDTLDEVK